MPIWETLTREEHEAQYNPQHAVPDFTCYQAGRQPLNDAARELVCEADVAYGPGALHKVDIYPAKEPAKDPLKDPAKTHQAPVHGFFHGGYWRAQDKKNFAFVASQLVARGITTVIANYELCPAVTLDETVASAVLCLEWVAHEIGSHGGDATNVTISGHSAGAHLGAACLAVDWPARGLAEPFIKGAVLTSGIYDPAPAALTSVNADIRLTPELIARHDYERRPPQVRCPVFVIAGAREPWHWIDQSYRYAHHLHRHGLAPGVIVSPGYHHFDIMDQYADPASDVLRSLLSLPR